MPVRHTCRLRARGRVADQAAHQGTSSDNARNAVPNALRDVLWREIRRKGRACACPGRAIVGARGAVHVGVFGSSLSGVVVGLIASVDLKYHRDRTRPTHQYSSRVGKVPKALRHNADYFVVYRITAPVERERAFVPRLGYA